MSASLAARGNIDATDRARGQHFGASANCLGPEGRSDLQQTLGDPSGLGIPNSRRSPLAPAPAIRSSGTQLTWPPHRLPACHRACL